MLITLALPLKVLNVLYESKEGDTMEFLNEHWVLVYGLIMWGLGWFTGKCMSKERKR